MTRKTVGKGVFLALLLALSFLLGYETGADTVDPVAVTIHREAPQVQAVQPAPEEAPMFPVNLNTATKEQLDTLPGIGPALADRILTYRQEVGRFIEKSQLMDVSGIGEAKYAELEALITVEEMQ